MSERKVYKPKPVSGFPEWLPEERLVEQQWFDHIRRVFESYGFCNIETPSVEELDVIAAKGEVDKEIYVIERLHKEEGDKEARLALHFDQTVPLARYVAQRFNELVFPFKRYQMQRVWRGERPQAGRFREFYQCDIDVINIDALPLHFDAEMPAIIWEVLTSLPGMRNEKIQLKLNNRKILLGLLTSIYRPEDQTLILRVLDKREKLKPDEFSKQLNTVLNDVVKSYADSNHDIALNNISSDLNQLFNYRDELVKLSIGKQIDVLKKILEGHSTYENYQIHKKDSALPVFKTPSIEFCEGLKELIFVMENFRDALPENAIVVDFFMVRGLDYYTGTVYETVFTDDPGYGSICSGGRYDDLASSYINKKLPGVGISIGFSRLFARMIEKKAFDTARKSPAEVLMILPSEEQRALAAQTAQTLRKNGVKVELFHAPKKTGDQMKYASRKGIPFVWFPDTGEVKNMTTGEQEKANPESWLPA
jgi:histidyl-tRNA synthetase